MHLIHPAESSSSITSYTVDVYAYAYMSTERAIVCRNLIFVLRIMFYFLYTTFNFACAATVGVIVA